jgi:hypothetical protein
MNIAVRMGARQWRELCELTFSRYPDKEWATWVRFGWRSTEEALIFSMIALDPPRPGELDDTVSHVSFREPYSLRVALEGERHPFAVGVVHSHPKECLPIASRIDDDMDTYYADYLEGFTAQRPYLSLIVSEVNGERVASGRVWVEGRWVSVARFLVDGFRIATWIGSAPAPDRPLNADRIVRLDAQFGRRAAQRIRNATVAVVGASGTGSPAIEVLARAGVGHLIGIDPDTLEDPNLERVHGAYPRHAVDRTAKVLVAREHVSAIDPSIWFDAYVGRVPQKAVVGALVQADVILSCTDQQHSRLALSEIAFRYGVPVIDAGVSLEGAAGRITGQTIQLVRFDPEGPCALCRDMIDWRRVGQELMSNSERAARREAARQARERGDDADGYWRELPQLNTVGYLTTAAGALGAGCALGVISGTFQPGFTRAQFNLLSDFIEVIDWPQKARPGCVCQTRRGYGDLASGDRLITPPAHWPEVKEIRSRHL